MELTNIINDRYTVKKFDQSKKIDDNTVGILKDLLIKSPSSTNIQPWHFTIVSTDEGKKKLLKSTENYGFNNEKIEQASHLVVFSAKVEQMEKHLDDVLQQEDKDGRFPKEEYKNDMDTGRKFFYNVHKETLKDDKEWLEKQVYLNVGHFVLGAKLQGIDSVIMEGFDKNILNQELDNESKGLSACIIVGLGYGSSEDFNKNLPKSRLSEDKVIEEI